MDMPILQSLSKKRSYLATMSNTETVSIQVSVRYRVINGTAIENLDFLMLSDTVVMLEGEAAKPLPLRLIDDLIPELIETFYVQLENPVTGGAVLGSPSYGTISILASDDPVGAFGK